MSDKEFKLPGSGYDEVVRVIKAYGHYAEPVELTPVSQVGALHPTSVSRNVGFLVGVGVLEGGQKKTLTVAGRTLARALDHDMTDEIRSAWQQIMSPNEFVRKILSAIRIRNGMEVNTLQSHIAYSAGEQKTPKVMTGARTVVDILQAAGLVKDSEGKIVANLDSVEPPPEAQSVLVGSVLVPAGSPVRDKPAYPISDRRPNDAVGISIQIQLQVTLEDIDTLAPKIRNLLAEIADQKALPENHQQ